MERYRWLSGLPSIKHWPSQKLEIWKRKDFETCITLGGYIHVVLCNSTGSKSFLVHRLVVQAFIPNPNNFPCVNHKNEIRNDNRAENLEWCTYEYNSNYGTIRQKISKAKKGKHPSLETRQKLSKANKGKTPMLGHKHSLEVRMKMSNAKKGKHFSQETRIKMSNARKLYWENKKQIQKETKNV